MLDNKVLKRWLAIWSTIANTMRDLRMEGSSMRDDNPKVETMLLQAAEHLRDANKLLNQAILLASAND